MVNPFFTKKQTIFLGICSALLAGIGLHSMRMLGIILDLLFVSVLLAGFLIILNSRINNNSSSTGRTRSKSILSNPTAIWINQKPKILYHGTNKQAAREIWDTGLWLASEDQNGIWMSDNWEIAQVFAEEDGAIIVSQVEPSVKFIRPRKKPQGYYVFPINGAKPGEEYYNVPGIKIISVLDYNGKELH